MNPVEFKLLNEGGIRVIAEPLEAGRWLISEVIYVKPGAKLSIQAPCDIPSLQWLDAVLNEDSEAITAIELQYE